MASDEPTTPSPSPVMRASQLKKPAPAPATTSPTPAQPAANPNVTGNRKTPTAPSLKTPPAIPDSDEVHKPKEPAPVGAAPDGFALPAAIYSPQLLETVTYDIQYYLDWIRQNQIRKTVGAKPKAEPNHSAETVLVIEAWLGSKPATIEALEALLAYLKNLKLPEVHIMLAALPNRSQRETLVNWLRANAAQQLLVSFVADRNLGGGIVIRTPNHVFDYSWKQELVAARDKLAGILKRV